MWIVLKKILLGFNELRGNKFYTVYPAYDVIKMDLIIKEDGGWLVLFGLQYIRNKACFQKFK